MAKRLPRKAYRPRALTGVAGIVDPNAVHVGDSAAGGDLAGTYPAPTLAVIGAGAGPIGDATHVAQTTIDAKGRVTALTSVAISGVPPGGAAGGDLSGSYPNPSVIDDSHAHTAATLTGVVPSTRTITTTTPIRIDAGASADLSADRTLSILAATTTAQGSVELATDGENAASVAVQGNDNRLLTGSEVQIRIFKSGLTGNGAHVVLSAQAMWAYVGRMAQAVNIKHIEFHVIKGGTAGLSNFAEVALASSPLPPNRAGQTLTKIIAYNWTNTGNQQWTNGGAGNMGVRFNDGFLNGVDGTGVAVAAGTHLWVGLRIQMGGGSPVFPTLAALMIDMNEGNVLLTTATGALTGSASWTGSLPSTSPTTLTPGPDLRALLD